VRVWNGFIWLRIGSSGGSCKHDTEIFGSIKVGEFVDLPSDYQLLKKDSAPWK
jgi:hypothetical protein